MSLFELDTDAGTMMRHDPRQIRARQFARVRRGFDPEQVRAFLDEVATQMEQLQSELRFSQEEAEAAARQSAPDPYTQLGSTVAELIRGAEEHAARVRREAQEQSAREVGQAKEQVEQTKQEAQALAKRVRSESQAEAERARAEANAEAERLTQEAQAAADRLRREAEAESSRLREEARTALDSARSQAEATVSELRAERDRLIGDIRGARGGLGLAIAGLDDVLGSIGPTDQEEMQETAEEDEEEEGPAPAALTEAPPPPVEQLLEEEEDLEADRPLRLPTDLPPLPDLWEFTAQLERPPVEEGEQSDGPDVRIDPEDRSKPEKRRFEPKDLDIQIPDIPLLEDRKDPGSS